jgi:trigger factor
LDQITENNPVEVPPSLVRQEQERMVSQQLNMLQGRGLNIAGLDPEKMLERVLEVAQKQTRVNLILDKIAALEGLTVTDEDMETGYQRVADQAGDSPQMVKKVYQQRQLVDDLKSQIRAEKTVEFLIDKANVNSAAAAAETVEKES